MKKNKKYNGKTLREWSEETGIKYDTLSKRIKRIGLSIADATTLTEEEVKDKTQGVRRKKFNGKSLRQWSRETGIKYNTIFNYNCSCIISK